MSQDILQFQGPYRWLSNFAPVRIQGAQLVYPSVEHAYMSAKCDDMSWKYKCTESYTPAQIKKMSRGIRLRSDWATRKLVVMRAALELKYAQEPYKSLLLATGDVRIQEGNYWNDKFWGVCLKTGLGENHLGNMIMEIRTKLLETLP